MTGKRGMVVSPYYREKKCFRASQSCDWIWNQLEDTTLYACEGISSEVGFFLLFKIHLCIVCIWVLCLYAQQKMASDPMVDSCEPPCEC